MAADRERAHRLQSEAERIALSLLGKPERDINNELHGWRQRNPEMCGMIESILREMRPEE